MTDHSLRYTVLDEPLPDDCETGLGIEEYCLTHERGTVECAALQGAAIALRYAHKLAVAYSFECTRQWLLSRDVFENGLAHGARGIATEIDKAFTDLCTEGPR